MQVWNWMRRNRFFLITTEPQPPPYLATSTGAVIKVKERESGHKWLGCMLSSAGSKSAALDIDYHLQSANRAFFANKSIFLSEMCPSKTNWNYSTPSWHQLLVLELGPDASGLPIWTNLISTSDVWSVAWLELQAGFAGRVHGTKFCIFGISVCEKWLRYATFNNGNLLPTSWAFHSTYPASWWGFRWPCQRKSRLVVVNDRTLWSQVTQIRFFCLWSQVTAMPVGQEQRNVVAEDCENFPLTVRRIFFWLTDHGSVQSMSIPHGNLWGHFGIFCRGHCVRCLTVRFVCKQSAREHVIFQLEAKLWSPCKFQLQNDGVCVLQNMGFRDHFFSAACTPWIGIF